MNATVTLPTWALIIVMIFYCLEKIINLNLIVKIKNLWLRLWILIFYHNDQEYYKDCMAAKEAKKSLARHRASKGGNYDATSLPDLINKGKKEKK